MQVLVTVIDGENKVEERVDLQTVPEGMKYQTIQFVNSWCPIHHEIRCQTVFLEN